MVEVVDDVGGVINTRSAGALPRNSQQVSYYKSKEKLSKHNNVQCYASM